MRDPIIRLAAILLAVPFCAACGDSGGGADAGDADSDSDTATDSDSDADGGGDTDSQTDTGPEPGAPTDWTNSGGNARRNCRVDVVGPAAADLLWEGAPTSQIAWPPFIAGRRVFLVRQSSMGVVEDGQSVVALDLDSGDEEWTTDLPVEGAAWYTWLAGARSGRVYASRADLDKPQPLVGLDQETGEAVWESEDPIKSFAYDGVVFAENGDPIVADFEAVRRISVADGATLWTTPRTCSVSGTCGAALGADDAVYIVDATADEVTTGHVAIRLDGATGEILYQTPIMPGFTNQNGATIAPDGTVYVARTQNNAAVDFLYAFDDTGGALVERWHATMGWSAISEQGVAADGSIYVRGATGVVERRAAADGALEASSEIAIESGYLMAVDAAGKVYATTHSPELSGALYAFDADLSLLWNADVPYVNSGGPALSTDGTLVVAGTGTFLRAYRAD